MEPFQKFLAGICGTLLLVCAWFTVMTCNWVGPGYVGIVVKGYGDDRGVDSIPIATGYVWYNRWMTQVFEYPYFRQQAEFKAVEFASKEGIKVTSDMKFHYTIPEKKAAAVFVRLRGDEKAVERYLQSCVQDAMTKAASTMSVNEIYGEGKTHLLEIATEKLNVTLEGEIEVNLLGFAGAPVLPPNVVDSINLTITAQQNAIAAENKVAQSKAEADQKIEDARGRGESILLEAKKQAEANLTLSQSLTPELVRYQALQKWDGKLPQVSGGGAVPFIDVNNLSK